MTPRGLAGYPDNPLVTCAGCLMVLAMAIGLWLLLAWVGLRVAQAIVWLWLGG